MKYRLGGLVMGLSLLLVAVPMWAHHSSQAEFDFNKPVNVAGTVTRMEWINPHSYLFVEVDDNGKTTKWAFELVGPEGLRKAGLSKSDGGLKPGDAIKVSAFAAKDGTNLGFITKLVLADGRIVNIWNNDPNAK
jgi:Family of unknown function (DUF6152)